ncbi:MAG: crotonase/enoyl-CoA hydratase family protein [Deltaproteobacteria bacterium]|nr:crotonase/enoyl-CoA hydratase family protein [Deltaproteobacteria bacterium]
MAAYEVFAIDRHEHVGTLWLANAERRNAMGPAFWDELPRAIGELDADDGVRAVVLAARGPHFTVGLDLKSMGGGIAEGGGGVAGRRRLLQTIGRLQGSITAVAQCSKPVIAAVHGYCIGGGIDLITACDVRIAAADATFSIRETRMAMVADVGTLQRLPAIIGKGQVAELAFTGDDFGAERAREIGFVNSVYADQAAVVDAAHAMAVRMAANSPLAVAGTKRVLAYCEGKSVEDGLAYVAAWNAAFVASEDLGEAISAFFEKRAARFRGR